MLEESDLRAILQFFYFTFLEPDKAKEACTTLQIHAQSNMKEVSAEDKRNFYIKATYQISKQIKDSTAGDNTLMFAHGQDWLTPDGIEWGVWLQFLREIRIEELHSMIWVSILGSSVERVAKSLDVNEGTIVYRLNQAHKNLGKILSPEVSE